MDSKGMDSLGRGNSVATNSVQPELLVNLSLLMQKPTGISTYALNIVPHLRSLSPTLLTAQNSQFPGFRVAHTPVDLTPEFGSRGHLRRLWWTQTTLPQTYRQRQSSLIFSPVPEIPLWQGCRTVAMVHDFIPLRFPRWKSPLTQYFRWVVPQVLQQAVHLVCNSESTAADIVRFGGVSCDRITPIPLAYDAEHFRPLELPRQNYFLYLGRQDTYKNLDSMIAAFGKVAQGDRDCELWIAGSQDPRFSPQLKAQAAELGIAERVKFLEYVPYSDLPQLINQAQALIFPSLWEGFGLPVLEALACGTPVIAGQHGALPEVGGEAVLWVDVKDIEAIAQGIRRILHDPQLSNQLSLASLAQAQKFSWTTTGEQTAAVLEQFL